MPSFDILKETTINKSGRVAQMAGLFDISVEEKSKVSLKGSIPVEGTDWNIGLIVGPSGCGKSTIAKEVFGDNLIESFNWSHDKSILDDFPSDMSIKEITNLLGAVGFGSAPNWVRPFSVLSNGEKFRVTVARAMAESDELIAIDEFTSVIDRQVAQVASHTIQKLVRKKNKKFIAVACHYDIIDWLQPDWIYQPEISHYERRCLRRRPDVNLEIYKIDKTAWRLFSQYHYLSHNLHQASQCFGAFVDGQCIAFSAYLHFPHKKYPNVKKGHRLVVHPDWQGLGIGGRMDDWMGLYLYKKGFRYYNTVAHPGMIAYYSKSPRWKLISQSRNSASITGRSSTIKGAKKRQFDSCLRSTKTFCFIPSKEMLL